MAAGAGSGRMLQEYLVSLGVQVDQRGMRKMQSALTMTKASVIGITGALAAMVTGIVKASASLTNTAQKYEDMARSGKKAVDVVARQEMALKAMGKTLDEVNKNDRLKRIYEDLQGIGSELSMPAAEEGRRALDGLGLEMSRMKMTAMYAFQWINHHFLNKLAGPMSNLRKQLEEMRKNVILNMPKITQVVGNGLAYFMQLMMAGVQGVKDLAGWIANLPTVVLQALGAFAGLWGVMKASPIFWILAGLTSLLMLLDDFQVYKAGGKSAFSGLWEGLEDGTFGDKLGEMLDEGVAKLEERVTKFTEIGSTITKGLVDAILGHDFEADGSTAGTFLNNLVTAIGNILTNPALPDIFGNVVEAAGGLIGGLLTAFAAAMGQIDFNKVGGDIGTFVTNFITRISDAIGKAVGGEGTGEGGVLQGVAKAAESVVIGFVDLLSGFFGNVNAEQVVSAVGGMVRSIFTSITNIMSPDDAAGVGEKISNLISGAITLGADIVEKLVADLTSPESISAILAAASTIGRVLLQGLLSSLGLSLPQTSMGDNASWIQYGSIAGYDQSGKPLSMNELKLMKPEEQAGAVARLNQDADKQAFASAVNKTLLGFAKGDVQVSGVDFGDGVMGTLPVNPQFGLWERIIGSDETAMYDAAMSAAKVAYKNQDEKQYVKWANYLASFQKGHAEGMRGAELGEFANAAGTAAVQAIVDPQSVKSVETDIKNLTDQLSKNKITLEMEVKPPSNLPGGIGKDQEADMFNFGGPQASGGRFNRFSHVTVSEDGQTEYIIPMNKPERAKGLILQALAEMGTGARGILQSFGMSGDHGVGSAGISTGIESRLAMAGAYPSGGSSSMKANSDNVFNSNPTIYVYSNDPVIAGQTAAKETDRVLMKHIRGPYG